MTQSSPYRSPRCAVVVLVGLAFALALMPAAASADRHAVPNPDVEGPIPGSPPGDPTSDVLEETYPFFASYLDLAGNGFVEEEFFIGTANAYSTSGESVGSDLPYKTRIVVRRPASASDLNGTRTRAG